MDFVRTGPPTWRKYSTRFFLLLILLCLMGCSEDCLPSKEQPCGKMLSFSWGNSEPLLLTSTNSKWQQITDDACGQTPVNG